MRTSNFKVKKEVDTLPAARYQYSPPDRDFLLLPFHFHLVKQSIR